MYNHSRKFSILKQNIFLIFRDKIDSRESIKSVEFRFNVDFDPEFHGRMQFAFWIQIKNESRKIKIIKIESYFKIKLRWQNKFLDFK